MTSIADTNPFIEHPATYKPADSPWGEQYKFQFPNGYGASVIRGELTYGGSSGKWELGVLYNDDLTYDTPITSDVLGWLDEAAVRDALRQIAELPAVVSA